MSISPQQHTRHQLDNLLEELESELKNLELWGDTPPPMSHFESDTPFFADVMSIEDWLQWVMIEQFRYILEKEHPLPENCSISPYAEEVFKQSEQDATRLLALLKQIDDLF